jgi:hypothetical protein
METSPQTRVCPRCGSPARSDEYCQTCGLHLFAQPELPSRASWEAGDARTPIRAAHSPTTGEGEAKNAWLAAGGIVALLLLGAWAISTNEPDVSFIERTVSSEQNGGFPVKCEPGDAYDAADTFNGHDASYTCFGGLTSGSETVDRTNAGAWEVTIDEETGDFRYDRVR